MKNSGATYDIRNEAACRIGEIVRDTRLHEMVLIVLTVAQVQVLSLDTEPFSDISAQGGADSCVIDVFTKGDGAKYDFAFNSGCT